MDKHFYWGKFNVDVSYKALRLDVYLYTAAKGLVSIYHLIINPLCLINTYWLSCNYHLDLRSQEILRFQFLYFLHMNEIISCLFFSIWLISLGIMPLIPDGFFPMNAFSFHSGCLVFSLNWKNFFINKEHLLFL